MSLDSQDNKISYTASGSATYAIPFQFIDNEHIELYIDDVKQDYGSDYTVVGEGDPAGGTLTLVGTPYSAGEVVHIVREVPITQEDTLTEGGPNSAKSNERRFDRLTMICQQLAEKLSRAIKFPLTSNVDTQFTGEVVPNGMLVANEDGDALIFGPSYVEFSAEMDSKIVEATTQATNAANSATASGNSATDSANSATASDASKVDSSEHATTASRWAKNTGSTVIDADTGVNSGEYSAKEYAVGTTAPAGSAKDWANKTSGAVAGGEYSAKKYAQDAASSLAQSEAIRDAVQAALDGVGWQDTVPTSGNLVLDATYNGCMVLVDCSLGPVQITLPPISTLDLDFPFSLGVKKSDSSGNSITVVRANTDQIDGANSKTIGTAGAGAVFIPDADPSPNLWTSAEFGATAGNMTSDKFSGTGAQTAFTLSVSPGSKNNTQVYVEGIYQNKASYSLSGTTLTFTEAPPAGTDNIEVISGTTLAVGTPADATVTLAKLAQEVLNYLIPVSTLIWNMDATVPSGFVSAMNKSIGLSGADYNGTAYYALYEKLWNAGGLSTTAGDPFRISSAKGASAAADWAAAKKITIDFETNEIHVRAKGAARALGSYEADAVKAHTHRLQGGAGSVLAISSGASGLSGNSASSSFSNTAFAESTGGTQNTVRNTAMYAYMKY